MRSDKSGSQLVDSLDNKLRGAVLEGAVLVKVDMGTKLLVREVGEDVGQRKQTRAVGGDAHGPSHVGSAVVKAASTYTPALIMPSG